jgi:hypothetical protein
MRRTNPSALNSSLPVSKIRGTQSIPDFSKSREVFLGSSMAGLSLGPSHPASHGRSQAASPSSPCPAPRNENVTVRRRAEVRPCTPSPSNPNTTSTDCFKTPVQCHKEMMQALEKTQELCNSAYNPLQSPARTPFLTKDSNLRGFTAWDVDGRIQFIEQNFEQLKGMVNHATNDRQALVETLELYKSRGESRPYACEAIR